MTLHQLESSPAPAPSRRGLLLGAAGLSSAALVGQIGAAQEALAAPSYRVNPFRKTKIPTAFERHLMNRMGCGYSRGTWQQMRRAGGPEKWFTQQLRHSSIAENAKSQGLINWFPDLKQSPRTKWVRNTSGVKGGWAYARDVSNYSILRRVYSNRQVHETMVEFWSNHLHVPTVDDLSWPHRYSYDQMIRRHALGRFDQMLTAATLHPAMLTYLDNWRSEKDAANENHGRELLELHTVGRTSGYTEAMVKHSATLLSGYTVDVKGSWNGHYDRRRHTTGSVRVLGFSATNASSDGRTVTQKYLHYLAHHPATARTIARKLALRFVSDTPSDALVNHLAKVFRNSGTDIKATLRALVAHKEFRRAAGRKVRTPVEDLVATLRVLQVNAAKPANIRQFGHVLDYLHRGLRVYQWPRPDGPPDRDSAWSSATRMLGSFRMHWNLAGGWYPTGHVVYRRPTYWLPQRRIRLDAYVDHMCRMLHGKPSTSRQLKAVCQATGLRPREFVTRDHALGSWLMVRLVSVLLDTPNHMSR